MFFHRFFEVFRAVCWVFVPSELLCVFGGIAGISRGNIVAFLHRIEAVFCHLVFSHVLLFFKGKLSPLTAKVVPRKSKYT